MSKAAGTKRGKSDVDEIEHFCELKKKPELTKFEGGATRSKLEHRFDLIPREAVEALSRRLTLGAERHGEHNWKQGGPEFVRATVNHLQNHLLDYIQNGNTTEANTDAIICNAAFLCYFASQGSTL